MCSYVNIIPSPESSLLIFAADTFPSPEYSLLIFSRSRLSITEELTLYLLHD
jgi:hypothetical protein